MSGTDETITTDSSEARVRRFAAGEAFSHIYGESIDWRPPRADMARVLADLDAARAAAAEQRARAERAEAREAEGKKREAAQSTWIHSLVAYIGGCGPRPKMLPARDEDIPVVLDMLDSAALAGGRGDVSAAESGGPAESAR